MAGYPPDPSYGSNYREQNNNYMPSYDQQQMDLSNRHLAPNLNYPPQNAPDSFAAYNMASAQYNANLPAFGAPSFSPAPYAPNAPSFQMPPAAWNASAVMPSNPMGWQQQQPFNFAQPSPVPYGLPRIDTNSHHQVPQQQVDVVAQPVEDGELSEGEFQDNFGGKVSDSVADANNNMSGSYYRDSNGYRSNASPRENVYRDSPRSAAPPNGRRSGQQSSRRRQDFSSSRHYQSDNYSPYGSPRQMHSDTRGTHPNREGGYTQMSPSPGLARDFHHPSEMSHPATVQTTNVLPNQSFSIKKGEDMVVHQPNNTIPESLDDVPDDDRYSPELERSSTPDKRTLAQHAILNLMAAKVQFQDYIQEGVDEPLMHGLFESLGMPQTRSKAVVEGTGSTAKVLSGDVPRGHGSQKVKSVHAQHDQAELSGSSNTLLKSNVASDRPPKLNGSSDKFLNRNNDINGEPVGNSRQVGTRQHGLESTESPSNSMIAPTNAPVIAPNDEERKDKIARLLAESQKNKATVPSPTTDSAVPNVSSQAAITAEQAAKSKAEKGRLLNVKLDNLRKSREARARKNGGLNKAPVTPISAGAKSTEIARVSPVQTSSQILSQSVQPRPEEPSQLPSDSISHSAGIASRQGSQVRSIGQNPDTGAPVAPLVAPAPKEIIAPQPAPVIPGLFLSSMGTPIPPTNGSHTVPAISHRKRPVAADFDEPTLSGSYKRPFGQSRVEKPLVIDVSDDESSDGDEGTAMDLDRPESSRGSTGPIPDIVPSKAGPTTRSQPFEPETRHVIAQPNIPVQLPRPSQPNAKPSTDDLKSKMDQIAELHKKIAEAEAKKKAKASATRSGSQTPLTTEAANAQRNMVNDAIAEKNKASAELERLLEGADAQIASETQKLADTAAKEQEKAAEMRQRNLERKRKRRSEIQLGLPVVDAEVEKNQKKLEDLRAEMAKAEAAIQKGLEDKQKLESEMAKLGEEAEERLQAEQAQQLTLPVREAHSNSDRRTTIIPDLQPTRFLATPERVDDPIVEDSAPGASSSATASYSLQNGVCHDEQQASSTEVINPLLPDDVDMSDVISHHEVQNDTQDDNSNSRVLEESAPLISNQQNEEFIVLDSTVHATSTENSQEDVQSYKSQQMTDETLHNHSPMSVSADQVLEAALQQASAQAEEESRGSHNSDIGNTYAPDPSRLEPDTPSNHSSSEGEIREISSAQSSAHISPIQVEDVVDYESDAYEPPEATPSDLRGAELLIVDSPPFSPAPPEVTSGPSPNGVPEMSTTNLEIVDSIQPLGSSSSVQDQDIPMSVIAAKGNDRSGSSPTTFFTPYESPLKPFSSYRFNKNFNDEIPSGFRSISYSHRIDPMKVFCRFELAGGACNDTDCEFQHFKDLNLADDMILLQLGDSETFNDQLEVKDSFVTGLRSVLQDLKARKIRDFPTIASEIAAFRAKFNAGTLVL